MYKTLLADTDNENLKNFKKYISVSYPDFKVIKTLSTYRGNYIDEIVKLSPQLIIADVRFFGANSSFSFSEIGKRLPWVRFILYGTLNDMDYLKKSIESNGLDYMLKPVKPSDLGRKLESARTHLDQIIEKEKELKKLSMNFIDYKAFFENQFMQNLIKGIFRDEQEIRDNFTSFGLDLDDKFTAVQIKIDNFKRLMLTLEAQEKHRLIYNVFNVSKLALVGSNHLIFINSFNAVTVVISGMDDILEIYKICDIIKNDLLSKLNCSVTIGIGRTYETPMDIQVSYNEAESATSHRFYMGYNTIIPIEFVEEHNFITFRYPILKEKKLVFAAATGEFEYCKLLLDEIFDALRKSEPLPNMLISQIVVEILISIGRYLREQNKYENTNVTQFFPTQEAMQIKTLDEGYTYLYSHLKVFCAFIIEQRRELDKKILDKAICHVKLKYYEMISLQKAALLVKTTPDYLNKLFLYNENESYFEYVTNHRMEVAKKFLIDTDMDDNMIAVNIGYDDGKYFKAIFKQYVMIEPAEFRSKYR